MALGFFSRLKEGLTRSTQKLTEGITGITAVFKKRRLDDAALEELEDVLISADLGTEVARRVIASFRRSRFGKEVTDEEIRQALAEELAAILEPVAQPLRLDPAKRPHVVLVVGVNGTGKTTTIGKLAQIYREQGKRPVLVAGDTFRAAAVEQLQIWGERVGAPVIAGRRNADAAGLAFEALTKATADGADVLLIDTAGRLHNRAVLMDELRKIIRVLRKQDETAPHSVLAGAGCDDRSERGAAGAGVQGDGGRDWPGGHQARRQRARRDRGGAGGDVRAAGTRGGGGREGERPAAVRCRRISQGGWWGCRYNWHCEERSDEAISRQSGTHFGRAVVAAPTEIASSLRSSE